MTAAELTERMARVAVALKRSPNTFRVDARPFGDGWAAFVDGDFDTAWLEHSGRGATEAQACDSAWLGVRCALADAHKRRDDQRREFGAALARAAHDVALYTAALAAGS